MKMFFTVLLASFCFLLTTQAFAQSPHKISTRCQTRFLTLAQDYSTSHPNFIQQTLSAELGAIVQLHSKNFKWCGVKDLYPGSFAVQRLLTICVSTSVGNLKIGFLTEGDYFCKNERVLSFLGRL